MVSEKELLLALFNTIGALAKRLTGDTLVITIKRNDGLSVWTYGSPIDVSWCRSIGDIANLGEVESLHAQIAESFDMPVESRSERSATAREADQSAVQSANH